MHLSPSPYLSSTRDLRPRKLSRVPNSNGPPTWVTVCSPTRLAMTLMADSPPFKLVVPPTLPGLQHWGCWRSELFKAASICLTMFLQRLAGLRENRKFISRKTKKPNRLAGFFNLKARRLCGLTPLSQPLVELVSFPQDKAKLLALSCPGSPYSHLGSSR